MSSDKKIDASSAEAWPFNSNDVGMSSLSPPENASLVSATANSLGEPPTDNVVSCMAHNVTLGTPTMDLQSSSTHSNPPDIIDQRMSIAEAASEVGEKSVGHQTLLFEAEQLMEVDKTTMKHFIHERETQMEILQSGFNDISQLNQQNTLVQHDQEFLQSQSRNTVVMSSELEQPVNKRPNLQDGSELGSFLGGPNSHQIDRSTTPISQQVEIQSTQEAVERSEGRQFSTQEQTTPTPAFPFNVEGVLQLTSEDVENVASSYQCLEPKEFIFALNKIENLLCTLKFPMKAVNHSGGYIQSDGVALDGGVYKCEFCPFGCPTHSESKHHVATHKVNRCPYCSYTACNKSVLNQHTAAHEGERPFSCQSCCYKATTQAYLQEHVRTVHQTSYEHYCAVCGYCVNSKVAIDKHLLTHTRAKRSHSKVPKLDAKQEKDTDEALVPAQVRRTAAEVEIQQKSSLNVESKESLSLQSQGGLSTRPRRASAAVKYADDVVDEPTKSLEQTVQIKEKIKPETSQFMCCRCEVVFGSSFARKKHVCVSAHKCVTCHLVMKNDSELKNHIQAVHTDKNQKLIIRELDVLPGVSQWKLIDQLIPDEFRHLQRIELNAKDTEHMISLKFYRCNKCYVCFVDKTSHDTHVQFPCSPALESFNCQGCDCKFSEVSLLQDHHIDSHTEFSPRNMSEVIQATVKEPGDSAITADAQLLIEAMTGGQNSQQFTDCQMTSREKLESGKFTVICKLCPMITDQSDGYSAHLHALHMKGNKNTDVNEQAKVCSLVDIYSCNVCDCEFSEVISLEQHIELHLSDRPFVCHICLVQFADAKMLAPHISSHSKRKKRGGAVMKERHICDVCGYTTLWKNNFDRHVKSHSGVKDVKCSYPGCSYATYEKDMLNKHITNIHKKEQQTKLLCQFCGYQTTNKYALKAHVDKHDGNKKFRCNLCGFATQHSSSLTVHMRSHTGYRPFVCSMCGKSFTTNSELRKHEKRHAGTVERKHKCTLCSKQYSTPQHLCVHMRTHTGQRPFKCNICSFAATSKSVLVNHMPIHTGEKNFKCQLCDFTCASSGTLSNHRRLKHKIVNKRRTLAEATSESLLAAAQMADLANKKNLVESREQHPGPAKSTPDHSHMTTTSYIAPAHPMRVDHTGIMTTTQSHDLNNISQMGARHFNQMNAMTDMSSLPMSGITPLAASLAGIPGINMPPPGEIPPQLLNNAVRQSMPPY